MANDALCVFLSRELLTGVLEPFVELVTMCEGACYKDVFNTCRPALEVTQLGTSIFKNLNRGSLKS